MNPPEGKELIRGEIADYVFEDGILVSYSKSPKRTVENIKGNMKLVKSITGNRPVPLLIFLSNSPMPDKETRKFASLALPEIYTAMAMVTKGGLGAFIINLLYSFQSPPIPVRSFKTEDEARKWLRQFITE
jgi:hypothetical protein